LDFEGLCSEADPFDSEPNGALPVNKQMDDINKGNILKSKQ